MIRSTLRMAMIATFMAGTVFAVSSPSEAAFKLFLDDLGDASPGITVQDQDFVPAFGDVADSSPVPGLVQFNGSIGSFAVVVSTGVSKPLIGPPDSIDFINLDVSGGSGGTLVVRLTDTDFMNVNGGATDFAGSISGNTQGSISALARADDGNAEYGGGIIGTFGTFDNSGQPANAAESFSDAFLVTDTPYSDPYSMTIEATITHDAPGDSTDFDFFLTVSPSANEDPVPEPATWLLGSMALLGFALALRRRQKS